MKYTDKIIEEMWLELEDVPTDENEKLCVDWNIFKKGDDKYNDVWSWFAEHHSKGIDYLVNEFEN